MSPLSHLPPHPTLLDCHRAPVWVPWVIQQIAIGYLFYIWWCKSPRYSLHTSHPFPPPLPPHPQVCSLCVFLHCCPENKFISTTFLDSTYMHQYTIFIFLSDVLHSERIFETRFLKILSPLLKVITDFHFPSFWCYLALEFKWH